MSHLATGEYFGSVCDRTVVADAVLSRLRHDAGRRLPPHTHEAAFFSLLLSGGYSERWGGSFIEYAPFTLVFHPPAMSHTDEVAEHGGVFFMIELSGAWLGAGIHADPRPRPDLLGDALALYRAHRQHDSTGMEIEERLWNLVAGAANLRTPHETASPQWLSRVLDRLHDDFRRSLTIARLARDANVHPVHLGRTFRSRFGMTVGEYLHRVRLEFIVRELARGRSLGDLAYEAGFADQAHMTRVCRALTGATPKEFRRLLMAETLDVA